MNYKQIFRREIKEEIAALTADPDAIGPFGTKCVFSKAYGNYKVWHIQLFEKLTGEQWHTINLVAFNNKSDYINAFNGNRVYEFVNDNRNQQADYLKWI